MVQERVVGEAEGAGALFLDLHRADTGVSGLGVRASGTHRDAFNVPAAELTPVAFRRATMT
jgi:hypothetical protein